MLAQAASAQALEKSVIQGFNAKLANRTASFQASNSGVRASIFGSQISSAHKEGIGDNVVV